MRKTWFERAIFLSWYCSKGDCSFCYMSTQKDKIKNPNLAKRKKESILAEAAICRACRWKVEFLSGGYESYDPDELVELTKEIYNITNQKQWLNVGVLKKQEIEKFKPYIEGVCGAVECINPKLHDKLCPSKPVSEIIEMFKVCDELGLRKSMTIIVGLGETEDDIPLLIDFIEKNKVDKITFYALNPHEGTGFTKGPETNYYAKWISAARKAFPGLQIVAGSWVERLEEIPELLKAGADAVTKFPSIKLFNSRFAKQIEDGAEKAGREFEGTMTKIPDIDLESFDEKVQKKIKQYVEAMKKNS
jgi:biotin synthase-like enzyme